MLCQKCGKNEAELHFVQTINGERTEALLCGKCAADNGFSTQITFTNFLQGFMGNPNVLYPKGEAKTEQKCEFCGMSLREMRNTGKAGCSQCYNVFKAQMESIIKNVQAGVVHTGKFPKRAGTFAVDREIRELKGRLAEAVQKENYEEAASIRDAIKALKGGCGDGTN